MNHSITIEDFNIICRICLESKSDMITLISPMIIYMLETCTSVQEISNKKMPQQICIDCYGQLKNAFHFKEQYLVSIRTLSEIILQAENRMDRENNTEMIELKTEYHTDEDSDTKLEVSNEIVPKIELNVKEETETENTINTLNAESNNFVESDCDNYNEEEIDTDSSAEEIFHRIEEKMMRRKRMDELQHANEEVSCETCGKKFKRKYLRRHRISHSENRPYKCDICPAKFKQSFNLKKHKKNLHSPGNQGKELCFICGKLITYALTTHLETHKQLNGDERFKCDQCNRVYLREKALQIHIRLKHSTNEAKCKICNKIFTNMGSVRSHMVFMHLNSKQRHVCEYCNKIYKRKGHLSVHIRTAHLNERPHSCTMCEKKFYSTHILANHMRTHTGERPFSCHICGKSFGFKSVLTTHMKQHSK